MSKQQKHLCGFNVMHFSLDNLPHREEVYSLKFAPLYVFTA